MYVQPLNSTLEHWQVFQLKVGFSAQLVGFTEVWSSSSISLGSKDWVAIPPRESRLSARTRDILLSFKSWLSVTHSMISFDVNDSWKEADWASNRCSFRCMDWSALSQSLFERYHRASNHRSLWRIHQSAFISLTIRTVFRTLTVSNWHHWRTSSYF